MSRPFSYNDINFTVIGNILFLHIKILKEFKANESIIEIPPAIYERMANKSFEVQLSSVRDNNYTNLMITTTIAKSIIDGKYYLYSSDNISKTYSGCYLLSWYFLYDI